MRSNYFEPIRDRANLCRLHVSLHAMSVLVLLLLQVFRPSAVSVVILRVHSSVPSASVVTLQWTSTFRPRLSLLRLPLPPRWRNPNRLVARRPPPMSRPALRYVLTLPSQISSHTTCARLKRTLDHDVLSRYHASYADEFLPFNFVSMTFLRTDETR